MSARDVRALEPTSPTSWSSHTVRQRSEQAAEVVAVDDIVESMVRFQGTAWARRRLPSMPEGAGVQIPFTLSDYNQSYGGVDRDDTLVASWQRVAPECVLR